MNKTIDYRSSPSRIVAASGLHGSTCTSSTTFKSWSANSMTTLTSRWVGLSIDNNNYHFLLIHFVALCQTPMQTLTLFVLIAFLLICYLNLHSLWFPQLLEFATHNPYKGRIALYAFTGVLQRFCKLQHTPCHYLNVFAIIKPLPCKQRPFYLSLSLVALPDVGAL